MISILLNWLYMGIFVFLLGTALLLAYTALMDRLDGIGQQTPGPAHVFFAGIMAATLYAQAFSLFYRVNAEANLLLALLAPLYILWQKEYLGSLLGAWRKGFSGLGKGRLVLVWLMLAAAIAYALASAGEHKMVDTYWYHAQTIRWIEEYGCVKGVGNLFPALGYNNAQHYFDALFSMKWLFGQSLRGSGGFFGLLIFFHGLYRVCRWKRHTRHLADSLALGEIAYSIIVTAFYTDPYVDTLPNALALFLLTEWLALVEEKKEDVHCFGFYSLLAVFAVVCKTSAAPILLLAFYPACLLVRQNKKRRIPLYLLMGFGIALPYFATNVVTTGYPVYLLSALDIFNVPWKMDVEILKYSVDSMIAFARMPQAAMEEALSSGLSWIPVWFRSESVSHQLLYVAIAVFFCYDSLYSLSSLLRKKELDFPLLWVRICVYLGLAYWLFTIPQVRYCWSFLIFAVAVVPALYRRKPLWAVSLMLLLMYSGFYSLRTLGYMKEGLLGYPLLQADYTHYTFEALEKDGHTFYVRIDGGDLGCGYHVFPYLDDPANLERLAMGKSLRDGFSLPAGEE